MKIYYLKAIKQFCVRFGKKWEFVVSARADWKFFGFVEYSGFGRYVGITF